MDTSTKPSLDIVLTTKVVSEYIIDLIVTKLKRIQKNNSFIKDSLMAKLDQHK